MVLHSKSTGPVRRFICLIAMTLCASSVGQAEGRFRVDAIVRAGDRAGDFTIGTTPGRIEVAVLNNEGLSFFAEGAANQIALIESYAGQLRPVLKSGDKLLDRTVASFGPNAFSSGPIGALIVAFDTNGKRLLLQSSPGRELAGIAAEDGDAPVGKWSFLALPPAFALDMNVQGSAMFGASIVSSSATISGIFLWDAVSQRVVPAVVQGRPIGGQLTLQSVSFGALATNNGTEIASAGTVFNAANQHTANVLIFLGRDGRLQTFPLSDERLPDGDTLGPGLPTNLALNDDGVISFLSSRQSDLAQGIYRWVKGTVMPTGVVEGGDAPGGGTFARIDRIWMDKRDGSILVAARVRDVNAATGLYRFADGKLSALAAVGQAMPDGSIGAGLPKGYPQVTASNDAGQFAFVTTLADGGTAAYLIDADGTLTLLIKSGAPTELGTVSKINSPGQFGSNIGLNDHGQVALPVQVNGSAGDVILLLTPLGP
jgi:hypothetical protein